MLYVQLCSGVGKPLGIRSGDLTDLEFDPIYSRSSLVMPSSVKVFFFYVGTEVVLGGAEGKRGMLCLFVL